jgi:hypothetical protein
MSVPSESRRWAKESEGKSEGVGEGEGRGARPYDTMVREVGSKA